MDVRSLADLVGEQRARRHEGQVPADAVEE
jgi:hypothetical protein